MRIFSGIAVSCLIAVAAHGEFADYHYVPPAETTVKALPQSAAIARKALAAFERGQVPHYQIADYAGQREALKRASTHPELQVAVGAALEWSSDALFEATEKQAGRYGWSTAISSVDATALRIKVDLSGLAPDDELWVADTTGGVAFGPYTLADAEGTGTWLPTTMGEVAVLAVYSPRPVLPEFTVRSLSHFYEELVPKGTDCPVSADCIAEPALQEVSTGIGRMSVTDEDGNSAVCSGALLNNAMTEDLEPFFLTADHCFQDFPATVRASGVEVIWDMRTSGCPGTEPTLAQVAQLPRSTGASFLRNSTELDVMLLALADVPVAALGRAYLGWDTIAPGVGNAAVGIHHPSGTAMKQSIGVVDAVGVDTFFGESQTTIRWSEGITEGGSSGSPVLFGRDNRVFGVLSNGNSQSCNLNNARIDQYSSFRLFFSSASVFLASATPSVSGAPTYRSTGSPDGGTAGCMLDLQAANCSLGDLLLTGIALMTLLALGNLEWWRR